jgi:hypothetical protein
VPRPVWSAACSSTTPRAGSSPLRCGNGDPLAVRPEDAVIGRGAERTVGCGWFNGTTQLFTVFPLAQREQRRGTCLDEPGGRDGAIATPEPPFARR